MNWKKSIHAVISLVSAVAIAQSGVETMATTDLSRKPYTGVSWTWTACSDVAVRLAVQKNGDDFPTAGWGGTLFIGDGTLGCAVPGVPYMYNELLFDVERGLMPTNGRYAVQIIATNAAGRVEEWSRGMLTVRANPAAEGMPTNWNAYADLAAKVAPYINAEGILTSPDNAGALWGAVSNRTADLIIHSTTGAVATLEADVSALQSATQTLQGAVGEMRTNTYTKGETDARIVELSPPTDLTPATNYTDSALGRFAETGTVANAVQADRAYSATIMITSGGLDYNLDEILEHATHAAESVVAPVASAVSNKQDSLTASYYDGPTMNEYLKILKRMGLMLGARIDGTLYDLPRVGAVINELMLKQNVLPYPTNAIPYAAIAGVPAFATPQTVTNTIRDLSLGGIWDQQLEVWWTPVMANGALTYQATTNVNLNAEATP